MKSGMFKILYLYNYNKYDKDINFLENLKSYLITYEKHYNSLKNNENNEIEFQNFILSGH